MSSLSMLPMCLHALFCLVVLVGAILFIVWAMRLKQEQLFTWVKWLLVVGILGCIITGALGGGVMMKWKGDRMMMKDGKMMMERMDGKMMEGEMMKQ